MFERMDQLPVCCQELDDVVKILHLKLHHIISLTTAAHPAQAPTHQSTWLLHNVSECTTVYCPAHVCPCRPLPAADKGASIVWRDALMVGMGAVLALLLGGRHAGRGMGPAAGHAQQQCAHV